MSVLKKPSKVETREWLIKRQTERKPLPDIEQIRRELGWDLIKRKCTG